MQQMMKQSTKKKIALLVLCCMLFTLLPTMAFAEGTIIDSGTCGASGYDLTWTLDRDGTLTITGSGLMMDFPWWSVYKSDIKKVTIESGVTSIGDYAFGGCNALTSITIPDSVTSIGDSAFDRCSGLKSITIPSSVTSIGENAFLFCDGLTSIEIPNGVTTIGAYAFLQCSGLKSIAIPDSVTTIEEGAFEGCSKMLGTITVGSNNPNYYVESNCLIDKNNNTLILGCKDSVIPTDGSVISIGDYAFYECSGLESITIPDNVTSIGECAFAGCSGLSSIEIPSSVTTIGRNAFDGCSGLISVTIPNRVTNIGYGTFYGCSGLTSITIPNGVTSIDMHAFGDCSGLKSITIPDSVTTIEREAFLGCSKMLETIRVEAGNKNYYSEGNCLIDKNNKRLILGCKDSVIPTDGSVTMIDTGAFYGCSGLENITIPDSVITIGAYAFEGCSGLTNIIIPAGVTTIYFNTFANCSGLTSVTIPKSVTTIYGGAFDGCTNLQKVLYEGTEEEWNAITIAEDNEALTNAKIFYEVGKNNGSGSGGGYYVPEEELNKKDDTVWNNPFTDVSESNWYYNAVKYVNQNKLMGGMTSSTFAPNAPLTRGMLVTILYRMEGNPTVAGTMPFADVNANAYYYNAILWAVQNNIVSGISATEFAPDVNITREQIASILQRYAQYKGYDTTQGGMQIREYSDYESISDYAMNAMTWAVNSGLLKGNNMIAPQDLTTRAEIAAILQRFIEGNK